MFRGNNVALVRKHWTFHTPGKLFSSFHDLKLLCGTLQDSSKVVFTLQSPHVLLNKLLGAKLKCMSPANKHERIISHRSLTNAPQAALLKPPTPAGVKPWEMADPCWWLMRCRWILNHTWLQQKSRKEWYVGQMQAARGKAETSWGFGRGSTWTLWDIITYCAWR